MLKMLVSAILFCGPITITWGHNDHHGQAPVSLSAEAAVTDAVNGTAGSGLVVDFRSSTERTPGSVTPRPGIQPLTGTQKATVSGSQRVMVLRVYFADYANTSRFSQTQVNGFFDQLNTLWKNTSYNNIDIDYQVSSLYQLPANRSAYIDDFSNGDLSNGDKFWKVLDDAIENAPAGEGLDWSGLDAIMVVMAETSSSQFHRGQGTGGCSLAAGPGGSDVTVGCAIFSENPSENENQVWGRWAHEIGHAFQQGGPAHPSNYNSEFELLDSNYPGQTGVFEKQSHVAFPGWLPATKYQLFTPASGGGSANIWAVEYDPGIQPNIQAVKIEITGSLYYLVSVRRRILGDDQNGDFSPFGIPDEGVLIERVSEGSDPWVTVQGPAGNRNKLWQENQAFSNTSDGVFISIVKKIDDDNYQLRISYQDNAFQPDVALEPWTSPPGNTWETTDIWVDSPVNGYGSFRYGFWNDLSGNPVPRGNGDIPAVGLVNRLYARVRNIGGNTATNVKVNWQITDPPGVGIAGATGWVTLGSVDQSDFATLASIPAGSFVDVYLDWTPAIDIPAELLEDGVFDFHTCLRVILDPVSGETVFGNQDGDREQENLFGFQATEEDAGAPLGTSIRIVNDDVLNKKYFYITYKDDLPPDWKVIINNGVRGVELAPAESRDIPVEITPAGVVALGSVFGVDLKASSLHLLQNDLDPSDQHPEYKELGGARVEVHTQQRSDLQCEATEDPDGLLIKGTLAAKDFATLYDPQNPFRVMIIGTEASCDYLNDTANVLTVGRDGTFQGLLRKGGELKVENFRCLFAGSAELTSALDGCIQRDAIFRDNFEN